MAGGFREGFVEADGFPYPVYGDVRIRYMEMGEEPALVHLHGAGGLRLTLAYELLSRNYRVIALPGFGASAENRSIKPGTTPPVHARCGAADSADPAPEMPAPHLSAGRTQECPFHRVDLDQTCRENFFYFNTSHKRGLLMAEVKIDARPNGPYVITGSIELRDTNGNVLPTQERTVLCRCGASTNKPFCDGTHSKIGFQAAAQAVPNSAEKS